jgi:DNA-binding transcriptional regulator YdaS (Cro superfamily)
MESLERAITFFGSLAALARAAGVSPQRLSKARKIGKCSPGLAEKIERATNGAIPKATLVWPKDNVS